MHDNVISKRIFEIPRQVGAALKSKNAHLHIWCNIFLCKFRRIPLINKKAPCFERVPLSLSDLEQGDFLKETYWIQCLSFFYIKKTPRFLEITFDLEGMRCSYSVTYMTRVGDYMRVVIWENAWGGGGQRSFSYAVLCSVVQKCQKSSML